MAPVEAVASHHGCCSSASPLPTTRASMMPSAHTHTQCCTHGSHAVAVASYLFTVCVCHLAHASVLDSRVGVQRVGPEGSDEEAKLHNQGEQPTSSSSNFRCAAHGEHVPASARAGNWRACTCRPLTSAQRSIRCSSAPAPRPRSSPSLAATLPSSPSPPPALFSMIHAPSRLLSCFCG